VLLVIANHAWDVPVAGFIGVDVFFVISGFVITLGLMRESERRNRVSIADFYRRRIRRIIPASILVLVTTVAATYFVYGEGRGNSVLRDGLWSAAMMANWWFSSLQTDYFASHAAVSPMQHYWSLAVEEQFYLVWPLLLGLAVLLARRGRVRRWRTAALLAAAITLTSFAIAVVHTRQDPGAAYFSSLDRAWELGVGALLATVHHKLGSHAEWLRGALGWVGLALIGGSAVMLTAEGGFPAPAAAIPVIGAALVLAGPWHHGARNLVLTNSISQYLGKLSYSLYLWHFPVLVLGAQFIEPTTIVGGVTYLALVVGLSAFSFHLVEDPIRHSEWLEPERRRLHLPTPGLNRLGYLGLAAAALAALLVTGAALQPANPPEQEAPSDLVAQAARNEAAAEGAASLMEQHGELLMYSANMTEFPDFHPDVTGLTNWDGLLEGRFCTSGVTLGNVESCTYGDDDSERSAVVIGDSFALAWMPGLRVALPSPAWQITQFTLPSCPWYGADFLDYDGQPNPICRDHNEEALELAASMQPDLVILAASSGLPALASGATGADYIAEIEAAGSARIVALKRRAAAVVILSPPPPGASLAECVTRLTTPADCVTTNVDKALPDTQLNEKLALAENATAVNVIPWFCVLGRCPGIVGNLAVYTDGVHLTPDYAEFLAPLLRLALMDGLRQQRPSR
jgi:peptidoglycan/LPS O-acetylase OafA/YrhL